ncbi:uncharacterized protein N7496_008373 [Penicillium cataractarum]|uniref:Uncharacterized protein n=1 Tax=Penicillium cataractarum TaxID=2100454 RepID=A0A9W9RYA2_9EURO|nr:uncharacterized protein N7496_008373 [Penicillium cataractarum]KAJ5368613.1 hypothetical protein N7496_008373 [Penicillium cataractarum]
MTSLKALKTNLEYSIKLLTTWNVGFSLSPYYRMASTVTDKLIKDLTKYLDQYANEASKSYPHYDYIVFFGNEVERLLLDVTKEMLKSCDEVSMGPPGLNPSVKKKLELAIQHIWVLRGMIRRQQKPEGRDVLTSRRRRQHCFS